MWLLLMKEMPSMNKTQGELLMGVALLERRR
jgi:hypothetical protein